MADRLHRMDNGTCHTHEDCQREYKYSAKSLS
jgi:hypothetical protein